MTEHTYLTEFPSFVDEILPPIPSTWKDVSWRNDACPCWETPSGLHVYIDYEKLENRDFPEMTCRFQVTDRITDGPNNPIDLDTDDWAEVLLATGDTVP